MLLCDKCKDTRKVALRYRLQLFNEGVIIEEKEVHYCDICVKTIFTEETVDILTIHWESRLLAIFLKNNILTINKLCSMTRKQAYYLYDIGSTDLNDISRQLKDAGFPGFKEEYLG